MRKISWLRFASLTWYLVPLKNFYRLPAVVGQRRWRPHIFSDKEKERASSGFVRNGEKHTLSVNKEKFDSDKSKVIEPLTDIIKTTYEPYGGRCLVTSPQYLGIYASRCQRSAVVFIADEGNL